MPETRFLITRIANGHVQELTWAIPVGREVDGVKLVKSVSECHAKIVREGQKWKLLDAITPNGCYVNDLQIGMAYLSSGDRLRFGTVECVFYLPTMQRQSVAKRFVSDVGFWILVVLALLLAIAAGAVIDAVFVRIIR